MKAAQLDLIDRPAVRSMGSHQSASAKTHTWLTPPHILERLGTFDLDPCACPEPRPWPTALTHWTREDGPLARAWFGRVWCNPPYGNRDTIGPWLRRMAEHNRGVALTFARTETALFFEAVWDRAAAVLFVKGRLTFHRADGSLPRSDTGGGNAGAPSCLIAYGNEDAEILRSCGIAGKFIRL